MFRKLRRALEYLERPELIRARRSGVRVDMVSELMRLRDELGLTPRSVVDVGANRGDYIRAVRLVFPGARISAFEPVPSLQEQLRTEFEGGTCRILPYALDRENSREAFFVTGADDLSSLLEPTAELRSRVESDEEAASESIEVDARRLDELLEFPPELQPVLIKLDVQGGELRALQGATGVLDQVACVQLEYDFDLLYEGQASLLDLFGFMISQGFSRFLQIDRHMSEGKIRRCDLLFFRDVPEAAPQATP